MFSSPYVVGQWVRGRKFYGRGRLIDEVLHGPRNWLWILGTRRIGKTSLLKQVEHLSSEKTGGGYFPVFWDFQGSDNPVELHRGFADALLDAEERLERIGITPSELEGEDLFDSLGRLRRRLGTLELKPLLLCDEVEELIKLDAKDPALLRKLRRAMQSHEGIKCVLASTIRLWALAERREDTSPFLHGFAPPLYVRGLDDRDALDLVLQNNLPIEKRPRIDIGIAEDIRSRCDNHPYLLQLMCKRYFELGSLEDAVEQVATDPMVSFFFSIDFEMLTEPEREVLRMIAETAAARSDSIRSRLSIERGALGGFLHRLEHLGYVRRGEEQRYELVNYFFRRWIVEGPHSFSQPSGRYMPAATSSSSPDATLVLDSGMAQFDGRYRLLEQLGHGATGVVYKATDDFTGETIAIKILKPEYSARDEVVDRFRQEMLLARDIGDPNILKVYHLERAEDRWYITMKWIGGQTLGKAIARGGPFPVRRAIDIAAKVASALAAAHSRGIIHRDVKPQNILLDDNGEPYLTDFGLARLLGGPGVTKDGTFVGTPYYASPEQAACHSPDERSDIYSLGVVMFEMVTGARPFRGETSSEVLGKHRSEPPPDPCGLREGIPPGLAEIILGCMQKDPANRPSSADAVRDALQALGPL